MIKKIEITDYKSIPQLDFEIGRFNVLIGENGCGKTNILEAIVFAACQEDLNNGNLGLKGVRTSEPQSYKSGFDSLDKPVSIKLKFTSLDNDVISYSFALNNEPYSKWNVEMEINDIANVNDWFHFSQYQNILHQQINDNPTLNPLISEGTLLELLNRPKHNAIRKLESLGIPTYMVYSPENHFLRNYHIDSPYTQPLGSKGEGLLKLVKVIKKEKPEHYQEIIENLHLMDWFSGIDISEDSISGTEFKIKDIYLEDGIGGFDIRNANEGFFLILFYITLFVSDYTPSFFAIDNIDTALNPKLCTKLIEVLCQLAVKHYKQVLVTAHNPAILDGLNLNDDSQRLFAVSRNKMGFTGVTRIEKKEPIEGRQSVKMSEQFLRGYIGGLPKNF